MEGGNMTTTLPLETYNLNIDGLKVIWPEDISDDAYTLIYTHSKLLLNKGTTELDYTVLYEAWAFDGKKSWHIWNRNGSWVCTVYDSEKCKPTTYIKREQLLLNHIAKTVKKEKLVIHELISYDQDDQAYIAYSCPIQLSN